jgi:malate synthase
MKKIGNQTGEWINSPPQLKLHAKIFHELKEREKQAQKLGEEITKLKEMLKWLELKENQ